MYNKHANIFVTRTLSELLNIHYTYIHIYIYKGGYLVILLQQRRGGENVRNGGCRNSITIVGYCSTAALATTLGLLTTSPRESSTSLR